jgi:soluble lytic murein transglycosylase-like protein
MQVIRGVPAVAGQYFQAVAEYWALRSAGDVLCVSNGAAGDSMQDIPDDNAKRRLTEPEQLSVVADFMLSRGYALDDIPTQLSRYYYVDLDLLNEILYRGAMPAVAEEPAAVPGWRQVA